MAKESVSVWRKCRSSLGHVDGGAALQRLQDPMAPVSPVPPDRLGASGLCQRLWPLQAPIYMTGEKSGLDQGEGKYEPDSSVVCWQLASLARLQVCAHACRRWCVISHKMKFID